MALILLFLALPGNAFFFAYNNTATFYLSTQLINKNYFRWKAKFAKKISRFFLCIPTRTDAGRHRFFLCQTKRSGNSSENLIFYARCAQNAKSDQNIKLLTEDGELKTCEYYPFEERGYMCVLAMQSGDKVLLVYQKDSDSTRYVYTDLATLESCVKK